MHVGRGGISACIAQFWQTAILRCLVSYGLMLLWVVGSCITIEIGDVMVVGWSSGRFRDVVFGHIDC